MLASKASPEAADSFPDSFTDKMPHSTSTSWSVEYETLRRQKLFKAPPKDRSAYPALAAAIKPHIQSFDALFENQQILQAGLRDIGTQTFVDGDPRDTNVGSARNQLGLRITEVLLEKPILPASNKISTTNRNIFPAECRERHATYRGRLRARLQWRVNTGEWKESVRELGLMPIMLRSNRCHLANYTPNQLVQRKEESEEMGGYFIVNGNEKLIRMLIVSRRNYPMALSRSAFVNRGPTFSKLAIQIRSVRPDQTSQTNILHYLTDGNVTFRFSWRKAEYLVPVVMILKALVETNDLEIVQGLAGPTPSTDAGSSFVSDRVEMLLRTYQAYGLRTRKQTLIYLGDKFAPVLNVPINTPHEKVGEVFLRKIVLPHLGNYEVTEVQNNDKFQMLLFMIRKLYALAAGDCAVDNPDAVSNQEVLLGGFLYGMILKEQLQEWVTSIGYEARDWCRRKNNARFADPNFEADFISKIVKRTTENVGRSLENFLAIFNRLPALLLWLRRSISTGSLVISE
jgi:DNA-directed RNA polymerase I subunit RPA2